MDTDQLIDGIIKGLPHAWEKPVGEADDPRMPNYRDKPLTELYPITSPLRSTGGGSKNTAPMWGWWKPSMRNLTPSNVRQGPGKMRGRDGDLRGQGSHGMRQNGQIMSQGNQAPITPPVNSRDRRNQINQGIVEHLWGNNNKKKGQMR